ncbi:hypothetical protein GALMADRAFT_907849 [Galerina marginata CBS 339.88]|uniref:Transmembrane protein n=1 Tax=Galerina marginata (strain CBS 339.88) TaxID=685588 RepID=A0A067SIB3_GALM3|nr:hypothetical protein GALMADRAFT_907849 [Galerina marginata CBS 339.88]
MPVNVESREVATGWRIHRLSYACLRCLSSFFFWCSYLWHRFLALFLSPFFFSLLIFFSVVDPD